MTLDPAASAPAAGRGAAVPLQPSPPASPRSPAAAAAGAAPAGTVLAPPRAPANGAAANDEPSSCFGRMWKYLKERTPDVLKTCAVAMIQFMSALVGIAAAIGINALVTVLSGSAVAGFCAMLPAAVFLLSLARVVSDAAIHALKWEDHRTRISTPVPFLVVV